jgi:hypothetical protein
VSEKSPVLVTDALLDEYPTNAELSGGQQATVYFLTGQYQFPKLIFLTREKLPSSEESSTEKSLSKSMLDFFDHPSKYIKDYVDNKATSTAFYLYLVDEITAKPVTDPVMGIYPIELTVTDDRFKYILPFAQNTLRVIKFANTIVGLTSMFGYNLQLNPTLLSEAQSFLENVGDDDDVTTIKKLYNLDPTKPNQQGTINVVESQMLQILQALYTDKDKERWFSGLQQYTDPSIGRTFWCSLESWNNRENEPGWTRLADRR